MSYHSYVSFLASLDSRASIMRYTFACLEIPSCCHLWLLMISAFWDNILCIIFGIIRFKSRHHLRSNMFRFWHLWFFMIFDFGLSLDIILYHEIQKQTSWETRDAKVLTSLVFYDAFFLNLGMSRWCLKRSQTKKLKNLKTFGFVTIYN